MITQSPHTAELLDSYHKQLPQLEQLSEQAANLLQKALCEQNIQLNTFERRVKTEESLAGKLEKKGYKYKTLYDVTDIVGIRVVTYYTDDVDKVAAIAKQIFDIDWKNSVDKRKHQLNSFGYLSLHYICYLKEGPLRTIPFEIQMRTALQHVWSALEHDIGYKGAVKLPPEFVRQFSRLAGMLEMADDEFSRLRTTMTDYRRQVQALVKSGHFSEVSLSSDSITDLDILSETVGLQNLCLVYAIKQGSGLYGIKAIYDAINGEQDSNTALAENILRLASQLPFIHNL